MNDLERVQKFCDQITKENTYPDSLKALRGISNETRDILTGVVRHELYNRQQEQKYDTELVLILRFLKPLKFLNLKFDNILGPTSVCQMSSPSYPHIFYIFGDVHKKTGTCPNNPDALTITNWIERTISTSPVFIDVYLESPYMYKSYKKAPLGSDNYLRDNYNAFHKCLIRKDNSGICRTSRFHYTDIRKIFTTDGQAKGFHLVMGRSLDLINSWNSQDAKNAREFYTYFTDPNSFMYKRIQKQFDNIQNKQLKNIITTDFKACTKKYKKTLKNFSPPPANTKLEIVHDELRSNRPELLEYSNCLMDYYLIARCFRTYKKTTRGALSPSGLKDKYSRPSYNNIVYVGEVHAKNYIKILNKIGFPYWGYIQRNWEGHEDFQCLKVSGMKQPMFHQRY